MMTLSKFIVSDRYEWGWFIVVDGQSFIRWCNEDFRSVEWHPVPDYERLLGMKNEETKEKGSEQPPTKVGLDDQRTEEKKEEDKKDGITDKVMEHQSKDHEVQRT